MIPHTMHNTFSFNLLCAFHFLLLDVQKAGTKSGKNQQSAKICTPLSDLQANGTRTNPGYSFITTATPDLLSGSSEDVSEGSSESKLAPSRSTTAPVFDRGSYGIL
uniref:Uncharacterized protein n=1 Tax=Eutreptiella gymnastica TaxID=73025 RepID=A0A7S4GDK9_9EUGL